PSNSVEGHHDRRDLAARDPCAGAGGVADDCGPARGTRHTDARVAAPQAYLDSRSLTATVTANASARASRTMIVPIVPSELKSRNGPSYGALGNPNVSAADRRVPRVLDSLSP